MPLIFIDLSNMRGFKNIATIIFQQQLKAI